MQWRVLTLSLAVAVSVYAQQPGVSEQPPPAPLALQPDAAVVAPEAKPAPDATATTEAKPAPKTFEVETNTRIPLSMINSVSTKNAAPGDRVYLETVFPILVNGRIVIPPGSYVSGTITKVQRPGKIKGRGEFYLRFDALTLPNGVTRDFHARVSGLDGRASEELDRNEGSIKSEGSKGTDTRTVVETTVAGAKVIAWLADFAEMNQDYSAGSGNTNQSYAIAADQVLTAYWS